jgi:ubiquinone/menaquinone biosynthesis C-methylase UbiE
VTDWSSYDHIAARYDDVWGQRFRAAADLLCERMSLAPAASALDIGTGTGIVLHTLAPTAACLTGCDSSRGMLRRARARISGARFVEADAMTLPFRQGSFDVVTASFVLSHLGDPQGGLREVKRVLKPGGQFAMTSWAADADARAEAWRELLADAVSGEALRGAVTRVTPGESRFESEDGVEGALTTAGFTEVEVHAVALRYTISLDQFLADREISSAGRFGRHTLGGEGWQRWVGQARDALQLRFGSLFQCSRGVLVARARRPW